jgi:hypothetical protein
MRVLLIAAAIVAVQWVLIHRYPEPRWVLVTLAVPALLWGLTLSGLITLVSGVSRRVGGGRR